MRYFAGITLSLIVLLNAFCIQPTEKRGITMQPEEFIKPVKLTGGVEKRDKELIIKYSLTNQSQKKIYVWDVLTVRGENGEEIYPDLAYRCFEEPETLRVVRAVLPLPLDRDVYITDVPYVHGVDPNKSITGQIVLPLPVLEYNPYYPPDTPDDQREKTINKIRLIIGWTELRSGMEISETTVGTEKVLMIRGAWAEPHYHIAETLLQTEAKMIVRTDKFDRRMPEH